MKRRTFLKALLGIAIAKPVAAILARVSPPVVAAKAATFVPSLPRLTYADLLRQKRQACTIALCEQLDAQMWAKAAAGKAIYRIDWHEC